MCFCKYCMLNFLHSIGIFCLLSWCPPVNSVGKVVKNCKSRIVSKIIWISDKTEPVTDGADGTVKLYTLYSIYIYSCIHSIHDRLSFYAEIPFIFGTVHLVLYTVHVYSMRTHLKTHQTPFFSIFIVNLSFYTFHTCFLA